MEAVTIASRLSPATRLSSPASFRSSSSAAPKGTLCYSPAKASLSTTSISPLAGGGIPADFSGQRIRLDPCSSSSRRRKRDVVTMVIPYTTGRASEQPPPDLASYLLDKRIVYLGMALVSQVVELIIAEFLYLGYEDREKPVYLYINSTGTTKGGRKVGHEAEAFGIYDAMTYAKVPVFTLCVGNAWGEAALLLAAGEKGNRAALPSANIMIRQPMARFQGQATDVELMRREIKRIKATLVKLYARHIGKSPQEINADIRRPKYFSPSEAVDYGIIDKVVQNERAKKGKGFLSDMKEQAKLI